MRIIHRKYIAQDHMVFEVQDFKDMFSSRTVDVYMMPWHGMSDSMESPSKVVIMNESPQSIDASSLHNITQLMRRVHGPGNRFDARE